MTELKLNWQCDGGANCFNEKARLKFELIKPEGFPGWTDIDAYSERCGNKLFLEWKSNQVELDYAQLTALKALTYFSNDKVIQISGDAETMRVDAVRICRNGVFGGWRECNRDELNKCFSHWHKWASLNPRQRP